MANEQKIEIVKPNKSKRAVWQRVLLFAICILIASVVWLVASYEAWYKEKLASEKKKEDTAPVVTAALDTPELLHVTSDTVLYG